MFFLCAAVSMERGKILLHFLALNRGEKKKKKKKRF